MLLERITILAAIRLNQDLFSYEPAINRERLLDILTYVNTYYAKNYLSQMWRQMDKLIATIGLLFYSGRGRRH